jgi:hypothetical protein
VIHRIASVIEIAIVSALILATRCANYQDVFVAGNVYFTDADCYARMTRVRMCSEHPWSIIRHHDFENFPTGTTAHTTAPLDYLIVVLAMALRPFTAHALDLAGAFISPLLALFGGWFLWWWSRRMQFRYRWVMLILYAISPILVHGAALGRPDHQSLSLPLVMLAICAEWSLQNAPATALPIKFNRAGGGLQTSPFCPPTDATCESCMPAARRAWWIVGAGAWALAIWVSAYEPLLLFLIACGTIAAQNRRQLFAKYRRAGWIFFTATILIALLIERRIPSPAFFASSPLFKRWAATIGELAHVSPANPVWLHWGGYFILLTPLLLWMRARRLRGHANRVRALPIYVLVMATYLLTIWQARWAYFFVLLFALALPGLLAPIKWRPAVWIAFTLSLLPILRDWDERLWPDETLLASRVERRNDSAQLRALAVSIRGPETRPFLAPWWLSPPIAYWSGQPGVAGSSHESLNGIADSARFFLSEDWAKAREILENRGVAWVFAYDSERVAQTSAAVLGVRPPARALCRVLDRTPSGAPRFLALTAQSGACKLYRVDRRTRNR